MKIPAEEPENFKINIQAFAQLLLFLGEKSIISEQFDFSIEDKADWNVRNTIYYKRPSETSLISALIQLLAPQTRTTDYSISRKDSFTAEVGRNDAIMRQKYSYEHNTGVDFLEHYNVNVGLGGTIVLNQKLANRISLNLTLGAKAEF